MDDWLTAALEQAAANDARARAILVTVAAVEGSVPREPGTKMLVDAARQWGTVGGGHLELRGAQLARAMLASGEARRLERFPLGPSLGQCCGGVVHLAFEAVDHAHLAALAQRRGQDSWRLVALDGAPGLALFDADGRLLQGDAGGSGFAGAQARAGLSAHLRERAYAGARVLRDDAGRRWLLDKVEAPRAHLMLFGAGHVGAAIVRAMAELPCRITWADEREDLFPALVPHNVTVEALDAPEALAASAAPGTHFLVMTHSHALDQRLAEAILKRPGADWFGLIGSSTKRKQFERRLRERGVAPARLDAMVCPIGVPGIAGKEPAVIAVAVAAQLLMAWERARTSPCDQAPEPSSGPS